MIETNVKIKQRNSIIITFWHRAKICLTGINSPLYCEYHSVVICNSRLTKIFLSLCHKHLFQFNPSYVTNLPKWGEWAHVNICNYSKIDVCSIDYHHTTECPPPSSETSKLEKEFVMAFMHDNKKISNWVEKHQQLPYFGTDPKSVLYAASFYGTSSLDQVWRKLVMALLRNHSRQMHGWTHAWMGITHFKISLLWDDKFLDPHLKNS